ncbi:MAG: GTPase, partial [Bacteroidota bacterium]
QALLTDTVGFIQKLPTMLVAAFHATLEEIAEADLLLHVVDISHQNALNQVEAVHETLDQIEAGHIPMVTALNKVDKLRDAEAAREILRNYPMAVAISSLRGDGIPDLLRLIQGELYESYIPIHVRLPYQQGALISMFHEAGQVDRVEHERGGVVMQGRVPGRLVAQFAPWSVSNLPVAPAGSAPEEEGSEETEEG